MGLFDKLKNPIFFKDDSEAEKQLEALEELKKTAWRWLLKCVDFIVEGFLWKFHVQVPKRIRRE